MGISPTLVSEIVRRILEVAEPQRIILFGSATTGQMTKDSDAQQAVQLAERVRSLILELLWRMNKKRPSRRGRWPRRSLARG
jgi:predicted nucleotidyltransferase